MKDKTIKVKLSDLVMDKILMQIRPVNIFFVSRYRQHYRAGANMPPIIIQEGSFRVVSGNHRVTAMLAEYGPDHRTEVITRQYSSERAILEAFAKENATHGNPLDGISKSRMIVALINAGATAEEIASIFNVPVKRIEMHGEQAVLVLGNRKSESAVMPRKLGPELKSGDTMTSAQYKTHINADRGIHVLPLASQLTRWLKAGWIKPTEQNMKALEDLSSAIEKFMVTAAKTN